MASPAALKPRLTPEEVVEWLERCGVRAETRAAGDVILVKEELSTPIKPPNNLSELVETYRAHLRAVFIGEIGRNDGDFAFVGRVSAGGHGTETYLEHGDPTRSSDVFSMTKSMVGLHILSVYLETGAPIHQDAAPLVDMLHLNGARFAGLTIVSCLNHVSGLHTGFSPQPGKVKFRDVFNMVMRADKSSHLLLQRGVHGIRPDMRGHFVYDNYGSIMACAMWEMLIRAKHQFATDKDAFEANPQDLYFVRDACVHQFFGWKSDAPLIWPLCDGAGPEKHTWGFSGLHLSGEDMCRLAAHLYREHLPLLRFVLGDPYTRADGSVVANVDIVNANDSNVTPGSGTKLQYDYSFGCWCPRIFWQDGPGGLRHRRRYVCCIGMLGQLLLVDVDRGIIAARRHRLVARDIRSPMNHHPLFFHHVDAFCAAWDELALIGSEDDARDILLRFSNFLLH
jgi:hypothetical protein